MTRKEFTEILEQGYYTYQLECAASRLANFYNEKADAAKSANEEIAAIKKLGELNDEDEDSVCDEIEEVRDRWAKSYHWKLRDDTESDSRKVSEKFKAMEKDIMDTCKAFVEKHVDDSPDMDEDGTAIEWFDKVFYEDEIGEKCWKWQRDICRQINETASDLFHIDELWRGDNGFLGRD
ncbi:MAG: hypothetical protein LUB83_01950 [Prevotellaceae bacterium]|nr:hypothetical protein [Prevotellaceae bacterium]